MNEARYAIYFVPEASTALYRFGAATIGYDCYAGTDVAQPAGLGSSGQDWRTLTNEPRRYGFHATLKAPFHLRAGTDEPALLSAFDQFARTPRGVAEFIPEVRLLGGFVAVMPRFVAPELSALADGCVTALEPFRAPLSPRERERRISAGLSREELENLDRWGYPYVFGQFRFHMTLTGRLPNDRRGDVLSQLEQRFALAHRKDRPIRVDRIALMHQTNTSARFVVLRHAGLCAST